MGARKSKTRRPGTAATSPLAITIGIALVALVAAFILIDAAVREAAIQSITDVKTTDWTPPALSLESGTRYRTFIPPVTSMDGRWWILFTEDMLTTGSPRLHATVRDNSPHGREVHWSSLPSWILAGVARLGSAASPSALLERVGERSLWFGPLTLGLGLAAFASIFGRAVGWRGVVAFILAFTLSPLTYQAFRAGEVDHHGLVMLATLFSALALAITPERILHRSPPSRWPVISGICGGVALWLSASSFLPIVVALGLAAATGIAFRLFGKLPSTTWRVWGIAGATTSMAAYLIEYFPNSMGWRLEVNHPLYALAWLAGGELLTRLDQCFASKRPPDLSGIALFTGLSALVILPGALIAILGSRVFLVADPLLLSLHQTFIREFQSLPELIRTTSTTAPWFEALTLPVATLLLLVFAFRKSLFHGPMLGMFVLCLVPIVISQTLGFLQIRWLLISASLWSGAAAMAVVLLVRNHAMTRVPQVTCGIAFVILMAGLPIASFKDVQSLESMRRSIPKEAAVPSIVARDIAWRLSQASRPGRPVVLASPNLSTELSYFADIRTIGTLYWENRDGLHAAARLFTAPDAGSFQNLLGERGITHIVIPSWDDFTKGYGTLVGGRNDPPYLEQILNSGAPFPQWLRPLYYPLPEAFGVPGASVTILAFVPKQTALDALVHRAVFYRDKGDTGQASAAVQQAASLAPEDPRVRGLVESLRALSPHQP